MRSVNTELLYNPDTNFCCRKVKLALPSELLYTLMQNKQKDCSDNTKCGGQIERLEKKCGEEEEEEEEAAYVRGRRNKAKREGNEEDRNQGENQY